MAFGTNNSFTGENTMKSAIYKFVLVIMMPLVYTGCNSTMYEIIEVEEPVEIKEEPPVTQNTEIKEETATNTTETANNDLTRNNENQEQKSDTKFSDKQLVSRTFAIQIGAFNSERNAAGFTKDSKNALNDTEIYYKNIDGQYKVRFGTFNEINEALIKLENVKSNGFQDAFLVELTYYKAEK